MARAPVCVLCGAQFGDLEPVHFNSPCSLCAGDGCEPCGFTGLHAEAARVRWHGLRLPELLALSVTEVCRSFEQAIFPSSAARLGVRSGAGSML